MAPPNSLLNTFLINLLLFVLALIGLELGFGGWLLKDPAQHLAVLRNVEYHFDVRKLYPTDENPIVYRRDAYGLRGSYPDPAHIDLLTVGGSATDERYLSEGETWQDQLAQRFRENGKSVAVVNAGVDGQSTYGHIKDFELWFPQIPNFRPSYVLLYIGVNDLFTDQTPYNDDLAGTQTWKGRLRSKSALFHLYELIKGNYLTRLHYPLSHRAVDFSRLAWTSRTLQNHHKDLLATRLKTYEENLKTLNEKIRALEATPIYVTQPSFLYRRVNGRVEGAETTFFYEGLPINGADFHEMLALMNEQTLQVCRNVHGICLDLAREVDFNSADFYDYFHNTPEGAKKIGNYLYSKLKDTLP